MSDPPAPQKLELVSDGYSFGAAVGLRVRSGLRVAAQPVRVPVLALAT
ncbi:hypothetical protein ACFCYX_18260 [Streptomyces populi]|nr:hypothetical protein [Streptomyces populi]